MARSRSRTIPAVARRNEPIPRATRSELVALEEEHRPRVRADCEPCPVCQEWRDVYERTSRAHLRRVILSCGHGLGYALGHTRPCVFVGCANNLAIDVNQETGSLKLNFPDLEVHELEQTCALDVAEEDGATLERVGNLTACTRERIRQIEVKVLRRLRVIQGDEF